MGEKIKIILLTLILGCLSLIIYKSFIDPTKVVFIPVIPNDHIPIAPDPDWILPDNPLREA